MRGLQLSQSPHSEFGYVGSNVGVALRGHPTLPRKGTKKDDSRFEPQQLNKPISRYGHGILPVMTSTTLPVVLRGLCDDQRGLQQHLATRSIHPTTSSFNIKRLVVTPQDVGAARQSLVTIAPPLRTKPTSCPRMMF